MNLRLIISFLFIFATCGLAMYAQDEIQFRAIYPPQSSTMSEAAAETLVSKVDQILNRNSAATGGDFGVFVVEPSLSIISDESTSGLVNNVNVVSGELTLTAKNNYDNAAYYSVTVKLKATAKNAETEPYELLAKSIKITDPIYVRFVRTARQNIEKYFSENCENAISRAKALFIAGQFDDAATLLLAIPTQAPCFEEAVELLAFIKAKSIDKQPETVPVAEPTVVPQETPVVAGEPVVPVAQEPEPQIEHEPDNTEIYISQSGWELAVDSCYFSPVNRRVVIGLKIKSLDKDYYDLYTAPDKAIGADGTQYSNLANANGWNNSFPDGLGVKVTFYINDIKNNPGCIALFRFSIGNVKYEFRNLTVR